MRECGVCLIELLEEAMEKKKRQSIERLYNRFVEIIKEENPSPYQLLFILELIKWNMLREIINRADVQK